MAINDPDIVSPGRGADAPHGQPDASTRPSLLEELEAEGRPRQACQIAIVRRSDPVLADEIIAACVARDLAGGYTYSTNRILEKLRQRDIGFGEDVLKRHRQGACERCHL